MHARSIDQLAYCVLRSRLRATECTRELEASVRENDKGYKWCTQCGAIAIQPAPGSGKKLEIDGLGRARGRTVLNHSPPEIDGRWYGRRTGKVLLH